MPKYNLIIEWWGDYWHGHKDKLKNGVPDSRQKKRMALDISQKKYLLKCGYKLLTFWEHDVIGNKIKVKNKIICTSIVIPLQYLRMKPKIMLDVPPRFQLMEYLQ